MKKLFFITLLLILYQQVSLCQRLKIFDSGLFTFEYPYSYKISKINNAPHMLLKLESKESFFSVSQFDNQFDSTVSIWDDEIFESYKNLPLKEGQEISRIDKYKIQTKNGAIQCLRILMNTSLHDLKMKTVSYLFFHKGVLFVVALASPGLFSVYSSTEKQDKMLSKLYLK